MTQSKGPDSPEQENNGDTLLRVSSSTNVGSLGGAIYRNSKTLPSDKNIILRAVGAGAVNQAIKAVIMANRNLVREGKLAFIFPTFKEIESGTKTSLELTLHIKKVS